jgi:hypothetical protein
LIPCYGQYAHDWVGKEVFEFEIGRAHDKAKELFIKLCHKQRFVLINIGMKKEWLIGYLSASLRMPNKFYFLPSFTDPTSIKC